MSLAARQTARAQKQFLSKHTPPEQSLRKAFHSTATREHKRSIILPSKSTFKHDESTRSRGGPTRYSRASRPKKSHELGFLHYKFNGRYSGKRDGRAATASPRLPRLKRVVLPLDDVVKGCLISMEDRIRNSAYRLEIGLSEDDAENHYHEFQRTITKALEVKSKDNSVSSIVSILLDSYTRSGTSGVESQLKFMLQAKVANQRFKSSDIINQVKLADLRYPSEWYPWARRLNRVIHLHIGPTNSGKTYHALKCLERASTGCYAGPLRLLAHEVYTRLNAKGIPCNLVTGDEVIVESEKTDVISSCTVEMAPFDEYLDVAVIDEIQMISDASRGWAWTQALLGLKAKEIHLCGETRSLNLIKEIAASLGEKLIVHNYERLSPLQVAKNGLGGSLENLEKGDCVVSFSRKTLHSLQREIREKTGKEVAIVYGALPPEIRAQQAQLFNEQNNNYDILVASDAIGMGLNLSIKRIIFESLTKFDGEKNTPVDIPAVKQIGGRAGRYSTASQDNADATEPTVKATADDVKSIVSALPPKIRQKSIGYVTTLYDDDLPYLRASMNKDPPQLPAAGIKAPDDLIVRFSSYFPPGTPFSYILLRLNEISRMHTRYFLCDLTDAVGIADAIQQVDGLSIPERLLLCYTPASVGSPIIKSVIVGMARCVAARGGGKLLDIPEIPLEILDEEQPSPSEALEYITRVASAHQSVVIYLWLSYRLPNIFPSQALAFQAKRLLQNKLDNALSSASLLEAWMKKRAAKTASTKKATLSMDVEQRSDAENEIDLEAEPLDGEETARIDDGGVAALLEELGLGNNTSTAKMKSMNNFGPILPRVEQQEQATKEP